MLLMNSMQNINELDKVVNSCSISDLQKAYLFGSSREVDFHVAPHYYIDFEIKSLNIDELHKAICEAFHLFDIFKVGIDAETGHFIYDYERDIYHLYPSKPSSLSNILIIRQELSCSELAIEDTIRIEYSQDNSGVLYVSFNFNMLYFDGPSINTYFDAINKILKGETVIAEAPLSMFNQIRLHQAAWEQSQEGDLRYWERRLEHFSLPLSLPIKNSEEGNRRSKLIRQQFKINRDKVETFSQYCANHGVSLNSLFFTVYAYCLSRWSSKKKFYVTMMMQNLLDQRNTVTDRPVGCYTTTVLTEFDFSEIKSLKEYVVDTQSQLFLDMMHSSVSGIAVQRMLNKKNHSHGELSQVAFVSMVSGNYSGNNGLFSINSLSSCHSVVEIPQMILDHQIIENGDGTWIFNWDYQSSIFEDNVAEDIFQYYKYTITQLVDGAISLEDRMQTCLPKYQQNILSQINHNYLVSSENKKRLFDDFLYQVKTKPDNTALLSDDISLSYYDFYQYCLLISHQLKEQGVTHGDRVAILMPKCWQQYVAAMAVVLYGAVYVPLDDKLPEKRLAFIISICDIKVGILDADNKSFSRLLNATITVSDNMSLNADDSALSLDSVIPDDLAYIIFTSGSTGTPKGVVIRHSAAYNTIVDINNKFTVTPEDRVLAVSSFSFDLSVYDLFGMLAAGAAIVVPNNSKLQYAEYINDLIDKHSVSIWNSAPLLLNILTNKYKSKAGSVGASLRLVMLSGDWIPMYLPDDIQTIAKGKPDVISLGGATEASIWSIYHPYCKSDLQLPSIPYGVPLNNQYFYILDENLQPCPFYVVGDLYIGGLGLANGYWRDEEKTSAAFISHPFSDKSIYKTGDLGKYLSSGEIQFHGRSDSQVKVSGYRIEMGEVEYALTKINGIKQAVVVAPYSANGDRFLAAYYQLEAGNKLTSDHIESELRQSLPSYMVPTIIKQLDSLPLTKNGKLDRSALSKVKLTYSESEGEPPTTELQKQLTQIWQELLGERINLTINDDFFTIGGYSFLVIKLLQIVKNQFDISLSIQDFYRNPTIRGLERLIDSEADESGQHTRNSLVQLNVGRSSDVAITFVHPSGGEINCYRELGRELVAVADSYAIRLEAV